MGRQVNLDEPLSQEDKDYLQSRGRGYMVTVNERRFGVTGDREVEEHEKNGQTTQSPFYDNQEREKAVYDVGGAPLPGVVLDYNSHRVADRDNGQLVEFTGPGHTPGAFDLRSTRGHEPEGFESYDVDENGNPIDDHIDEDIQDEVTSIPNLKALRARLKEEGVEFEGDAKRDELEIELAVHLQDKRAAGEYPVKETEEAPEDKG